MNEKWKKEYQKERKIIWNKPFLFEVFFRPSFGVNNKNIFCNFYFKIVSNHRNGIDVDKFDYFERDSLYLGLKSNFQPARYIQCSRIINVDDVPQICLRDVVSIESIMIVL